MKKLASFLLAVTLLTACSKKEADPQPTPAQPAPAQAATINMAFDFYPTASSPASTQSLSLVPQKPAGELLSDRLVIKLEHANAANFVGDQVQFTLPLSRQKSGLVGTYTLASQPDASVGEVLVAYNRPVSASANAYSNTYNSNNARLEGSLIISAYDAPRRLISGTYTVKAVNVKSPFLFLGYNSTSDPRRDGDLRLTGTFTELPL
ncbi:hypothetical protein GCM10022409_23990 [Hymenobacter glaciei]|uniref:Lipoprotein n=1 Tax=Hymenobacter glaciei TaxID=877209 RepID=A0ABP7U907_9BACT